MELVSVLNGEEWSDHPRCVDPVLAAVGRAVNDAVDASTRERLLALAPDMIGTAPSSETRAARLVARCAEHALKHTEHDPSLRYELEWDLRHARRRLMRAGHRAPRPHRRLRWAEFFGRRQERRHIDHAAAQVVFAIRAASGHSTDAELLDLLKTCVADVHT